MPLVAVLGAPFVAAMLAEVAKGAGGSAGRSVWERVKNLSHRSRSALEQLEREPDSAEARAEVAKEIDDPGILQELAPLVQAARSELSAWRVRGYCRERSAAGIRPVVVENSGEIEVRDCNIFVRWPGEAGQRRTWYFTRVHPGETRQHDARTKKSAAPTELPPVRLVYRVDGRWWEYSFDGQHRALERPPGDVRIKADGAELNVEPAASH